GRPYYFGIQGYALNWYALQFKDDTSQVLGTVGDYLIDPTAFVGNVENVEKIIKADSGGVIMGLDVYNPAFDVISANQVSGYSDGYVGYDIVEPDSLTGDQYEVTFVKDSNSVAYKMFWTMTNVTTNQVIIDSSDIYTYGNPVTAGMVYEGFIPRIKNLTPTFGPASYSPSIHTWYSPFNPVRGTGVYYVGKDIPQGGPIKMLNNASSQSRVIYGDDLRRVELRFGENGKAYRYLNGYIPTSTIIGSKKSSYFYAAGVTASNPDITPALNQDPTLLDDVGQLGQGFVDVPFTAWMVDEKHKETKQLAVAFIEMSSEYGLGKPDGVWDPTDSLYGTSEVIAILNADYDPTGNQVEYTGGNFNGTQAWGDIVRGYTIPDDASGVTAEQRAIAKSPWFNALYVVGLEKDVPSSTYKAGDKLIIPVAVYPYTSQDVYQFTTREGTNLTQDEGKELFKKVNVFPNPLYGFNPATSYTNTPTDNPFVTFSNLPQDVTITIYTLSGNKLRTLTTEDKSSPASSFLAWDLKNDAGVRVASGLYIAIVNSPKYGQKILKFSIIMPQKQLQKY
ncbi:MAG TPA: hypothetical protein VLB50_00650, partial [Ignavibacteriaceae bacterium]|nr:hypothetical protein [Ignavibacteriaceae bacterium]